MVHICCSIREREKEKNSQGIDVDNIAKKRPIGREAANAERRGKRKAEQVMDGIEILGENINKIFEVTEERKKAHEKITEAQL